MKKILLLLMALVAMLSASADSYFSFASAVNDTLRIKYESVGAFHMDTLCAYFDGRLDNWDLRFSLPTNTSISEIRKDVDTYSIPYFDEDGTQCYLDAPLYSNYIYNILPRPFIDSISTTITTFGYWDPDGNGIYDTYGTVKWEAGLHRKMAVVAIRVNSGIPSGPIGTLTISGMMSSTSDERGGTIEETTFTKVITVIAGYRLGDINGDGVVAMADLTLLIDYVSCTIQLNQYQLDAADVDSNGIVDVSDVATLIDMVLT